jgi:ankyrin repeat protein
MTGSKTVLDANINPREREEFWDAVQTSKYTRVSEMIAAGIDIQAMNMGYTDSPLRFTCMVGDAKMARLLLFGGADPRYNPTGLDGKSPFSTACHNGFVEIAQALVEYGVNPMREGLAESALVAACESADIGVVRYLAQLGAVHAYPKDRSPLLCAACGLGDGFSKSLEVVEYLLSFGPEVTSVNPDRRICVKPPLHLACESGEVDLVKLLLRHGADVHSLDMGHYTPLMHAVVKGYPEVAQLLIDAGADLYVPHRYGKSVIEYVLPKARKNAHVAAATLVLVKAMGLTPFSKVDGKTLLARFSDKDAKLVIKDAQREHRSQVLCRSLDDAMGCGAKLEEKRESLSGPSL